MLKLTRFFVSIAAICLPALLSATIHAADITVDSSCSLADAISAANSDAATGGCPAGSDVDTIALTGDVTLTAALPEIKSEIRIEGNGYTISGNERHQIFWVEEEGALTIQNATLADGRGADDDDLFDEDLTIGGAIVNLGSLNVSGSTLTGNSAEDGGAIFNVGVIILEDCVFESNTVPGSGGAINNESEGILSISDCHFINNIARSYGGAISTDGNISLRRNSFVGNSITGHGSGGAISIWFDSDASIFDTVFRENSAEDTGGAIFNRNETSIINSEFVDNSARNFGGAIFNHGEATISKSNFTNNTSKKGGAFYDRYGASIRGSTFTGNSAIEDGGAVYSQDRRNSRLVITYSHFTDNAAGDEGGAIRSTEDSVVNINLSVFRDNEAEDGGAIYSWGKLSVSRSTFTGNSAVEEGGAIANHGEASIKDSILADNPGGDCHLGRNGELLASSNNHMSDGSCGATWSGAIEEGYCPAEQELDGVCQIGALLRS